MPSLCLSLELSQESALSARRGGVSLLAATAGAGSRCTVGQWFPGRHRAEVNSESSVGAELVLCPSPAWRALGKRPEVDIRVAIHIQRGCTESSTLFRRRPGCWYVSILSVRMRWIAHIVGEECGRWAVFVFTVVFQGVLFHQQWAACGGQHMWNESAAVRARFILILPPTNSIFYCSTPHQTHMHPLCLCELSLYSWFYR